MESGGLRMNRRSETERVAGSQQEIPGEDGSRWSETALKQKSQHRNKHSSCDTLRLPDDLAETGVKSC